MKLVSVLFTIAFLLPAYEKIGCYGYPFDQFDPEKYVQSGIQSKSPSRELFCAIDNHSRDVASGADDVPLLTVGRNLRSTAHPYAYMLAEDTIPAEHDWIPVPAEATASPTFMYDIPAQHSVQGPFYNVQYGISAEPVQTLKPDSVTTPLPDLPSARQTAPIAEVDGVTSSVAAYSVTTDKNIENNTSENLQQSVGDASQPSTKSASGCEDNNVAKPADAIDETVVQPVEGITTPSAIPETTLAP